MILILAVTTLMLQTTLTAAEGERKSPAANTKKPVMTGAEENVVNRRMEDDDIKVNFGHVVDVDESQSHHWNEHEYYQKARSDMQEHHRDKVAKVGWNYLINIILVSQ